MEVPLHGTGSPSTMVEVNLLIILLPKKISELSLLFVMYHKSSNNNLGCLVLGVVFPRQTVAGVVIRSRPLLEFGGSLLFLLVSKLYSLVEDT